MEPKTRKEHYLAKIAGEDVTIPEPKTRQEHYLKEIANKPAPSGGDGGIFPVTTTITVTVIPGEMEQYDYSFSDANHTVTEISEALTENKLPVLFATEVLEEKSMVSVWYFSHIDNDGTIIFERPNVKKSHIDVHNGNKVDGDLA